MHKESTHTLRIQQQEISYSGAEKKKHLEVHTTKHKTLKHIANFF